MSSFPEKSIIQATVFICCLSIVAILSLMFLVAPQFWSDENIYLKNVDLFLNMPFHEYLKNTTGPAGPLFGWFHGLLEPVTGTDPRWVRLSNFLLVSLNLFVTGKIFQILAPRNSVLLGLLLLALPFNYVVFATAITDGPSFLLCNTAVLFWLKFLLGSEIEPEVGSEKRNFSSFGQAIVGGIALGLAFAARQYTVAILFAWPFTFFYFPNRRKELFLFAIVSLVVPSFLFFLWNFSLVPPASKGIGSGLAPFHLLLGLGYSSFSYLLINPSSVLKRYKVFALSLIITLPLIFIFTNGYRVPFKNAAVAFLPQAWVPLYAKLVSAFLLSLSFAVIGDVCEKFSKTVSKSQRYAELVFFLMYLGPIFSTIKLGHHFSGRYIGISSPMFIYFALKDMKWTGWMPFRVTLGCGLGLMSLYFYYTRV